MVKLLLNLRWLAVVIALFAALNALALTAVGILRAIHGYHLILMGPPWSGDELPGVHLARSIDAFLVAMVFVVFSIGTTTLFLAREGDHTLDAVPAWMRVRDLAELKFLIWEAILAAIVVASVEQMVIDGPGIAWTALVLPAAALILAAGLFLARRSR
jgi:uncharacterized membrane protein YqhA